jgi:cell division protein FtsB
MSIIIKRFFAYVLLVFTLVFTVNSIKNINRLYRLQKEVGLTRKQLDELMAKNDQLKRQLLALDDKAMEALVRDKLSMAKEGETIIVLKDDLISSEEPGKQTTNQNPPSANWQKWYQLFWPPN